MTTPEVLSDTIAAACFAGAWFCAGASWAAYRAVGWVERIKRWAYTDTGGAS